MSSMAIIILDVHKVRDSIYGKRALINRITELTETSSIGRIACQSLRRHLDAVSSERIIFIVMEKNTAF